MSRQTNYLVSKSRILPQWSTIDYEELVPHLTIVYIEVKFTIAKSVSYTNILRFKGLLLNHIAAIIPSHVKNGNDVLVAVDPSLPGTSESNPYGTELGLVEAIAKSLVCSGFWFEYLTHFLTDFCIY